MGMLYLQITLIVVILFFYARRHTIYRFELRHIHPDVREDDEIKVWGKQFLSGWFMQHKDGQISRMRLPFRLLSRCFKCPVLILQINLDENFGWTDLRQLHTLITCQRRFPIPPDASLSLQCSMKHKGEEGACTLLITFPEGEWPNLCLKDWKGLCPEDHPEFETFETAAT